MSPYILIDKELDALADPETPANWSVMVQKLINDFMADQRITIPEFHHYCERLGKVIAGRQEAACPRQS